MKDYLKNRLYQLVDQQYHSVVDQYILTVDKLLEANIEYRGSVNRTNKHHIIPRALDRDYIDDANNIVVVTIEDHIKLHKMLAGIPIKCLKLGYFITSAYMSDDKQLINQMAAELCGRKVVNLNTKVEYLTLTDAARQYNVDIGSIYQALDDKVKSCGCYWAYVDDVCEKDLDVVLEEYQNRAQRIQDCKNAQHSERMTLEGNSNSKPIINIDTGEIVQCARMLDIRNNKKNNYSLYAINRFTKIEGSLWTHYDDSMTLQQHRDKVFAMQRQYRQQCSSRNRFIMCVDTGKVYKNAVEASADVGIIPQRIRFAANTGYKADGKTWKYIDH